MNFGRNNYFDDNRRGNFRNDFDNGQSFGSNFENMRRQRSPIFNRDNFESQMPSDYRSSFPNRNFGYQPQQQTDSSKVYQIPIHVEKDDNTINNQNNLNNNYQNNERLNNTSPFNQHQTFYNSPNQQQSTASNGNFRDRAENEFRIKQEEMRRQQDEFRRQQENEFRRQQFEDQRNRATGNNRSTTGKSSEFRIPIRIEGDESNESNNLARDFNNMHYPNVKENKPGQKASHNQNEQFSNTREFNTPSFDQQSQFNNQQDQSYSNQFDNQQQQQPQSHQQPSQSNIKKPTDPMTIIQDILEEVEKYEHEIDYFTGEFQDKKYRYLDEYLTRCMLKLDVIDTNGDPNLKQARKNAVNYINRVIAKLEKIEKKDDEKIDQNETGSNKEEDNKTELDQNKEIKNDDELKKEENNSNEAKNDNKQDNSTIEKEQEKVIEKKAEKKKSTKTDTNEKKKIKKDDKKTN